MLVAGMGPYLVHQHLQAKLVSPIQDPIEIGERSERWIDVAVVGNVIAVILLRRPLEGRNPDGIDAEAGDVVELAVEAAKVSDAVVVSVGKTARIDLVDHRSSPPVGRQSGAGQQAVGMQQAKFRRVEAVVPLVVV
jgi:hypothetical protein